MTKMKLIVYVLICVLTIETSTFAGSKAEEELEAESKMKEWRYAIYENDFNKVRQLVVGGADVNAMPDDKSALMAAVKCNNIDMVNFLLANGADVNAKFNGKTTALMIADSKNNKNISKILIEAGAEKYSYASNLEFSKISEIMESVLFVPVAFVAAFLGDDFM